MLLWDKDAIIVGRTRSDLTEFPRYVRGHLQKVVCTPCTEARGEALLRSGFSWTTYEDLTDFIRAVCIWGGSASIGKKVVEHNRPAFLLSCFRKAHSHFADSQFDLKLALEALLRINGLGVSFASKQLRFLVPHSAAVLDSVIAGWAELPRTPEGR